MPVPRLRQAVLAARDPDPVAGELERVLGVRNPFVDEGVAHFGLRNAVYALGDTFVEIVSPITSDTAAGRYLDRRDGDCGYMAMFELADADAVRKRLADLGVRTVWETAHDDIVDLHLHPKDVPGAIVAVDITDPVGSWRWGGPHWTAQVPAHDPGGLLGLTVAALDPVATAQRWAAVLGVEAAGAEVVLADAGQRVQFVSAADDRSQGIVGVAAATTAGVPTADVAGVRFDCRPA